MECAFCHFCCDDEGGNAAGVAIFVRENGGQKSEENKEREIEKREESYGGSFRAARLSGGCYRSHRTTGGLLVVTYNSHPIRPSTHPSIHPSIRRV
jgi:hypothetical protein